VPILTPDFITVNGCRLQYQWHNPPASEAPTIVFLHEGLGSITRWRDFPAALCARLGWGGLVYDRQGYGGSDPFLVPLLPRFMHHEALEVLPHVLDAFDISRPVLLGHSDGASIALIHAGSDPASPAALILEAPHVFVEPVTVTSIKAIRDSYRSTDLRARLERHHGSNVDRLFDSWSAIWLSDGFRDWNIAEYLPAIVAPTLVIQGRDDEYGTVRQVAAIAGGISGGVETLLIDSCRHSPHIDQREIVEAAVVRFLQGLPDGAFSTP
jgi:pimeloyl-ACP methyl ester carboxylesterase